jgi:hypothetical protein
METVLNWFHPSHGNLTTQWPVGQLVYLCCRLSQLESLASSLILTNSRECFARASDCIGVAAACTPAKPELRTHWLTRSLRVEPHGCENCMPGLRPGMHFKFTKRNSHCHTVVLPNRPTDNVAGGSGAAGQWSGQQRQRNSGVRALPPGQQRQGMRYWWYVHSISHAYIICDLICSMYDIVCSMYDIVCSMYDIAEKTYYVVYYIMDLGVPRRVLDYDIIVKNAI